MPHCISYPKPAVPADDARLQLLRRLYESQILLGPGVFSNFVSTDFIGSSSNTVSQGGSRIP